MVVVVVVMVINIITPWVKLAWHDFAFGCYFFVAVWCWHVEDSCHELLFVSLRSAQDENFMLVIVFILFKVQMVEHHVIWQWQNCRIICCCVQNRPCTQKMWWQSRRLVLFLPYLARSHCIIIIIVWLKNKHKSKYSLNQENLTAIDVP